MTGLVVYAGLEFRRNRLMYLGWPLLIVGSVGVGAVLGVWMGSPAEIGMALAVSAWANFGVPLSAALFGAVTGAGVRLQGPAEEAALPTAPTSSLAGAALAAALGLLGSVALLVALSAALDATDNGQTALRATDDLWSFDWSDWSKPLLTTVYGWVLLNSCAVAYATGRAAIGGAVGLLGTAVALAPFVLGFMLQSRHFEAQYLLTGWMHLLVGTAASCAALAAVARAPQLGGWRPWGRFAWLALPLAASAGGWSALFAARNRLVEPQAVTHGIGGWQRLPARLPQGSLFAGRGARLLLRSARGETVLLQGDVPSLGDLLSRRPNRSISTLFVDRAERLWVKVTQPGPDGRLAFDEIWQGTGNGPLSRFAVLSPTDPRGLFLINGQAAFYRFDPRMGYTDPLLLDPAHPPALKRP
jgi:hypothetical protein